MSEKRQERVLAEAEVASTTANHTGILPRSEKYLTLGQRPPDIWSREGFGVPSRHFDRLEPVAGLESRPTTCCAC